jgi:hypothetical protein
MAKKLHLSKCAECEQLSKDYGDASLKRARAYGNLTLANLRRVPKFLFASESFGAAVWDCVTRPRNPPQTIATSILFA